MVVVVQRGEVLRIATAADGGDGLECTVAAGFHVAFLEDGSSEVGRKLSR